MRSLAASLGLRPTKQRGQNFVIDPNTVRRIVRAAGLSPAEHVLEIGPGLGSLTLALLAEGHRVTAVEIDPVLAAALPSTIASYAPGQAASFEVVLADAMVVGPSEIGTPSACVANLPYNVAVPVLLHLLEVSPSLRHGLVMDEILSELRENAYDMIVIGAHQVPEGLAFRELREMLQENIAVLHRMAEQLSGRGNSIAHGKHQQEGREKRHQTEITHGGGRSIQIVFVKLMQRVADDRAPRSAIADAERVTRE